MPSKSNLVLRAMSIVEKRGKAAKQEAIRQIMENKYDNGIISSALKYYAEVTLPSVMPIFPALISMSCEASKGDMKKVNPIGAAIMILAASGDIHDDIIDNSAEKYEKKTLYGKFGSEVAIVAGDSLLIQGTILLERACEQLSKKQKSEISSLVSRALFKIGKTEIDEMNLRKKENVSSSEVLEVVFSKGVVAETQFMIGGILGNADKETAKLLQHCGGTIGALLTMKDEFRDMTDFPELRHRIIMEYPPLPMVLAMQNKDAKNKIKEIVRKELFDDKALDEIAKTVLESREVQKLYKELGKMVQKEIDNGFITNEGKPRKETRLLLQALAEH